MAEPRRTRFGDHLAEVLIWVLLVPPACLWWLFSEHLPYRWRVRRTVRGAPVDAWDRLVDLWSQTDCLFGSMVGHDLASRLENDAMEAYVARHQEPESHCFMTLLHENPTVCAYALRALCRLRAVQDRALDRSEIPAALLGRTEIIQQQWACKVWTCTLGEYAEECLAKEWRPLPAAS